MRETFAYAIIVNMTQQMVPGKTELERYLSRGMTQQQIADAWFEDSGIRVVRSAIGMALARYGLKGTRTQERYEDLIPWQVAPEHKTHYDVRMLRREARRRRGLPQSDKDSNELENWKRRLHEAGAVITYDPLTEQGFWWLSKDDAENPDPSGLIERPAPVHSS